MISSQARAAKRPATALPDVVHPLGSRANVLLSSVFGPFAQDDEYGSRTLMPMELYHSQVTRVQGPFSVRMFHRSWGLMLIQANIHAPCTLLDFPTLDRFVEEIRHHRYDVVGISAIIPNALKVRKMCELVRRYQPDAEIVVGGHIANLPDLDERIDADHVVRGEGVRWLRAFLGEDQDQPIRHPQVVSSVGTRAMGVTVKEKPGDQTAVLIPSVGCPVGCNFCGTSAMFGGKGKFVNFYDSGDQLFDVMHQLEQSMNVQAFMVMDENFLLHRKRAVRLWELMKRHNKSWSLHIFGSANALRSYGIDQLVSMGISSTWLGLEGEDTQYRKLHGTDALSLVRELQSHGIRVMGSTIIGLENHTPENIGRVIDYAVQYDTEFHQFMLYTPIPGTPLHAELAAQGRMKDESEYRPGDINGQTIFNYRHPHIRNGLEAELIVRAFQRDFEVNGPSIARLIRTTLAGWKRYKNHRDLRIRRRYVFEGQGLATTYSAVAWAIKQYYRKTPAMRAKMSAILRDLYEEFGWRARLYAPLAGPYILWKIRCEEERLAQGWSYEPPTFCERNDGDAYSSVQASPPTDRCRFVTPHFVPKQPTVLVSSTPPEPAQRESAAHRRSEPPQLSIGSESESTAG